MLKYKKMELCLQSFISSTFLSVPNAARIVVRRNVFCTSLAHAINFTLLVYASYNFPIQIVCSPLSRNPTQDNKINNQVGDGLVLFTTVAQAGFLFRNDSSRTLLTLNRWIVLRKTDLPRLLLIASCKANDSLISEMTAAELQGKQACPGRSW